MAKNSRVYCVSIDGKGETFLYSSREFNVETIDISVLKKQGLPIPYPRDESGVSNSIGSDRLEEDFPNIRVLQTAIVEKLSEANRSDLRRLISNILVEHLISHRQNVLRGNDTKDWAENFVDIFEQTPRTLHELMKEINSSSKSIYGSIVTNYKRNIKKIGFEQ